MYNKLKYDEQIKDIYYIKDGFKCITDGKIDSDKLKNYQA